MRKLASVQRIISVEPIENADKIEMATVLGWQCVVNKGQFKPNDLAIYFEIDSFLPIKPEFEFLRASSYRNSNLLGEGFKLRTMTFRGQISQGLLLPISTFPELDQNLEVGTEVTEILGVRKWEIEETTTSGGTVIGTLPDAVPKTDEVRVQAEPDLINDFAGLEYYITTKMDGSSHSICMDENGFHITGHTFEYKNDDSCGFNKVITRDNIEENVRKYYEDNNLNSLVIQGELCAPGIQKNRLKLTRPEWYVFTIKVNGKRIGLREMQKICDETKLTMVPLEEVGTDLPSVYPTVESLLERANGEYPNGGKKEGIVIRPTEPVYSLKISAPLSMKVVSNKYLLKNE